MTPEHLKLKELEKRTQAMHDASALGKGPWDQKLWAEYRDATGPSAVLSLLKDLGEAQEEAAHQRARVKNYGETVEAVVARAEKAERERDEALERERKAVAEAAFKDKTNATLQAHMARTLPEGCDAVCSQCGDLFLSRRENCIRSKCPIRPLKEQLDPQQGKVST